MAPVVDRLVTEYEGRVEIRKMNVETDEEAASIASGFRVQYVPTFVFVNADGTTANTLVGEVPEDTLTQELDSLK